MKQIFTLLVTAFLSVTAFASNDPSEKYLLLFRSQVNVAEFNQKMDAQLATPDQRARALFAQAFTLKNRSTTQLNEFIEQNGFVSRVKINQVYWIVNAVEIELPKSLFFNFASAPFTAELLPANEFKLGVQNPVEKVETPQVESPNGKEAGLTAVGAPTMWNMGYTGRNRRALVYDTGIWEEHPAVRDHFLAKYLPYQYSWRSFDLKFPGDKENSHGTHVSGTISGLEVATRDTIGMAWNAYVMATDPIVSDLADVKNMNDILQGFQWAINPDGDTSTTDDIPDAINNSWGRSGLPDTQVCGVQIIIQMYQMVEAAGVANIFSAGNNGAGPRTIGQPQEIVIDRTNPFAIGALDGNTSIFQIASFRSRGPTRCQPNPHDSSLAIRPEVSAPGVNVRSAISRGSYANYNGTSMASPHVTGAVLLLKEAFPMATGKQVLSALYYSAIDLGAVGEDNVYGMGIINVPAAYNYLAQTFTPVPPAARHYDLAISTVTGVLNREITCDSTFQPVVTVRNLGDSTVNGFSVELWSGKRRLSVQTVTSSISPSSSVPVNFGSVSGSAGFNEWTFVVRGTGIPTEWDTINNYQTKRFHVNGTVLRLPFKEDFEGKNLYYSNKWFVDNPDHDLSWDTAGVGGSPRGRNAAYVRCSRYVYGLNQVDGLMSARIQMPAAGKVYMYFRYSHRFGLASKADSLRVLASVGCGNAFNKRIYSDGGPTMATGRGGSYIPGAASDWRDTLIDISYLAGQGEVVFRFETFCQKYGNIFIDDIVIDTQAVVGTRETLAEIQVQAYPNPSTRMLNLKMEGFESQAVITISDVNGRSVFETKSLGSTILELDASSWKSGVYFIKVQTSSGSKVIRWVKM